MRFLFTFRQWGTSVLIPNIKCCSVTGKYGKLEKGVQETKSGPQNSKSWLLVFSGPSQAISFTAKTQACLTLGWLSLVEGCPFPLVSIYLALICPGIECLNSASSPRGVCAARTYEYPGGFVNHLGVDMQIAKPDSGSLKQRMNWLHRYWIPYRPGKTMWQPGLAGTKGNPAKVLPRSGLLRMPPLFPRHHILAIVTLSLWLCHPAEITFSWQKSF